MWNNSFYPYYNYYQAAKPSFLKNIFSGFNFQGILDNTQKTLGVINQAIPVYNQIKPIWTNARTLFKIADGLKTTTPITTSTNTAVTTAIQNIPKFFA